MRKGTLRGQIDHLFRAIWDHLSFTHFAFAHPFVSSLVHLSSSHSTRLAGLRSASHHVRHVYPVAEFYAVLYAFQP